jgi:pyruvate/2-oxoglutarate dehydrogenase complex dihydrolipoamide dehydrogenase (E3) component
MPHSGPATATHRSPGVPGQHEKPLRFLVVGAGAVGGFVAGRLAGAGHHVTVLALRLHNRRIGS